MAYTRKTSLSDVAEPASMYLIWKIEKEIWLKGHTAMEKHGLPQAIITPPPPMKPQRMSDIVAASERARSFRNVELDERQFLDLGTAVIISYLAIAKHERFKNVYRARCSTTYVKVEGLFKIAGHTHVRLPKSH